MGTFKKRYIHLCGTSVCSSRLQCISFFPFFFLLRKEKNILWHSYDFTILFETSLECSRISQDYFFINGFNLLGYLGYYPWSVERQLIYQRASINCHLYVKNKSLENKWDKRNRKYLYVRWLLSMFCSPIYHCLSLLLN